MVTPPEHPETSAAAAVHAFLVRCLADQAEGELQPLEFYQQLWPEHGEAIARKFVEVADPSRAETVTTAIVPPSPARNSTS